MVIMAGALVDLAGVVRGVPNAAGVSVRASEADS
jgi:hypothetical protein